MPIEDRFHVEICDWANAAEREALEGVRATVFISEQHVPRELEVDDDDPRCVHVLARSNDGQPIGAGRLATGPAAPPAFDADPAATDAGAADPASGAATGRAPAPQPEGASAAGRIGRMAVVRDWRGRGVGTALLRTLVEQARARGAPEISLHAQRDAVPFYERHGFVTAGPEFEEAGIPHVRMRRGLEPSEDPERPPAAEPAKPVALRATSREELIVATRTLLAGARHGVSLLVAELHPLLLDDTACLVELRRLAISGRGASIRVVAQDLSRALQEGTRLLELAQRLSSIIEVRRPVELNDLAYRSAFMCVDTGGYLFRPLANEMTATGSTRSPGRHATLMRLFDEVWERSEPWLELRNLGI